MKSNIKVKHYENDPQASCAIAPEDGSWQLVIDNEGVPHLYVKMKLEECEEANTGMFCLDYLLPTGLTMAMLVKDGFGADDTLTEEEEKAAYEEYLADCEKGLVPPCPRPELLRS